MLQPAFFSAFRMAGTGAVANRDGSWAWAAWLTTRAADGILARGLIPLLSVKGQDVVRAADPAMMKTANEEIRKVLAAKYAFDPDDDRAVLGRRAHVVPRVSPTD